MSVVLEENLLAIDEIFDTTLTEEEAKELNVIQKSFVESYIKHKDVMPIKKWLTMEMKSSLPHESEEEIEKMSTEIIISLETSEKKKASLEEAVTNGRSKESWLATETKLATSHMSAQEASKYLQNLDNAIKKANNALYDTIVTQTGTVSLNPQLDGFIAEQYHAQTFNLNAKASGSSYRAKVLQPNGRAFGRNSVDIVISDESGRAVRRYQSKYCKDVEGTIDAFNKGDYRGQRKLVPDGQELGIKNASNVIEAPDGTRSNPLSKESSKKMQNEAQSGNWNDLNWNEYKVKDIAVGVGKQAGQAALMGAAIGVGFDIAQKAWKGEKIEGEEVVKVALKSGADFGIKAATAGAVKVGVEKGIISIIPKGTPAGTIANIVHVGIENAKVIGKIAKGELTLKEGLNKMEQVTVSTIAGIAVSAKGMAIGATIGTVFGPVGTVIGGFLGGTVGYMAGSKTGELIVKGSQKVREVSHQAIKAISSTVKIGVESVYNGMKSIGSGLKSLLN